MTAEVDSTSSGNTKAELVLRSRSFLITINQPEVFDVYKDHFENLKSCDYAVAAKEKAPTTGHEHIHFYVHLTSSYRFPKKLLDFKQHVDSCRGSPKQCIDYVKKDGDIICEWGQIPRQGQLTYDDLKEMSLNETPAPYVRIKEHIDQKENDLKVFRDMLSEIKNNELKAPEITYITGPSGIGKTYNAYKMALEKYDEDKIGKLTLKNDFVDVINPSAECFVIEEFRPSQMKGADFLQLIDKYGYRCNVKGGFETLRPKEIIICSIVDPANIYHDELNVQFQRRITNLIRLGDPNFRGVSEM